MGGINLEALEFQAKKSGLNYVVMSSQGRKESRRVNAIQRQAQDECGWLCKKTIAIVQAKGNEALIPRRNSGDGKGGFPPSDTF